jgi:hypothetical protein
MRRKILTGLVILCGFIAGVPPAALAAPATPAMLVDVTSGSITPPDGVQIIFQRNDILEFDVGI